MSLPSIDGLVWFVPEQTRPELPDEQIFIDSSGGDDSTLTFDGNRVSVGAGVPQIVLKVTTPYFGDPYNLRMSYRIFKGDEPLTEWKALEENRAIAIPLHGGGNYTLRVRKANGFGKNNYSEMQVTIAVGRRWHETWWFRGIAVAAVLLLFYGILRQRIKAIKKQNLLLEAKVRERTEHLEKTLGVLSDSEKHLEQQVRLHIHMIASISHDIRTPVKHMSYALDYSQSLIEANNLDSAISFMKQLKLAVENMYHMVDNLVNFIKPELRGGYNTLSEVGLRDLIEEKVSLFRPIANASNGAIQVDVAPGETVLTDPKLLGIIVHNLIDNAIKIREGNRVKIYTRHEEAGMHLIFEDIGPGMPSELLTWLNAVDPDEHTNLPVGYEGLGLLLLKQISKFLRLELYVKNNPGACIHLFFGKDNATETTHR
ncbi:HAMP domain-containing sensor histidine kinase [Dyadobacter sp. 676]|uniref:histidine kinase n=1 Tax=Dyadobacter sp. 676 TaxID=3088362 RepID=A0AAU8FII1_9BACT